MPILFLAILGEQIIMVDQIANAAQEKNQIKPQSESASIIAPITKQDYALLTTKERENSTAQCSPLELSDDGDPPKEKGEIAGLSKHDGKLHITLPKEIQGKTPMVEEQPGGAKVSTWGNKDNPTYQLHQYNNGSEALFQRIGNNLRIVSLLEAPAPTGTGATRDFVQIGRDGEKITNIDVTNSSTGDKTTYKAGDEDENITGLAAIPAGDGHPPGYSIQRGGEGGFGLPTINTTYIDQSGRFEMTTGNKERHLYHHTKTHRLVTSSEKSPDGESVLPIGSIVRTGYKQQDNNPKNLIWTSVVLPKDSPGNVNTRFWHNVSKDGEPIKLVLSGERFKTPQTITPETLHMNGDIPALPNISGWLMEPSPRAATAKNPSKISLVRMPASGESTELQQQYAVWTSDQTKTKITGQTIPSKEDAEHVSFPDQFP